jgi:sensor domain CHASE-containing protein
MKINERMKKFKSSMNLPCLIGIVIIILIAIVFVILHITLGSDESPYQFLSMGLIFM